MSEGTAVTATRPRRVSGIRARFVLILLLGVALPIGLVGVWLVRSARASAEAVLEEQLQDRLAEAARTIGARWMELRGPLLDLSEDPRVLSAVGSDAPASTLAAEIATAPSWLALEGIADEATVADAAGRVRAELVRPYVAAEGASIGGTLPVELSIFDAHGKGVGTLEAQVRLSLLIPPLYEWGAASGGVPAIFGPEGIPVVPVSMEPLRRAPGRFLWEGEEWLAVRRDVRDPVLTLTLAAPTAPLLEPFTETGRRGAVALLLVLGGALLLTLLLSERMVIPLRRLTHSVEEVATGRLDLDVPEGAGPDEVRRLGRAVGTMTASLRQLIRRVSQQESAAAVGEFAASLAHEVRNPLTSVRLDLERARERMSETDDADVLVARALQQVERLDATVSGALRVARSGVLPLTRLDLCEPLAAAVHTAERSRPAGGARIERWTPPGAPLLVDGNASALEQLFLNLLLNALEACDAGDARVRLEAAPLPDGVRVSVSDEGRGMTEEVRRRAFEPFFTTREEGTGLGLTVVSRIAQAHGARLDIESRPGQGTTVTVVFPLPRPAER